MSIRLSLGHIDEYDHTVAAFAHQLGLTGVQLHAPSNLPGSDGYWSIEELRALRDRCDADGLRIDGLENVPAAHFWKIQRGLRGRDEQIENYQKTIRNMATVGINLLGYNFIVTYVWRTDMGTQGRGGARVTGFDLASASAGNALDTYRLTPADPIEEPLTAEQMWSNYQYFLDAVLPTAEEYGVRLALHPDDPPVDEALGGAARIFTSPESLREGWRRAHGSSAWGLNFCIGTVSEMGGEQAVNDVIDTLGAAGKIFYVHFRDVKGTVPSFVECFLGEGNINPARVINRLRSVDFDGFLIDDHVPAMVGDVDTWKATSPMAYCSRGRAHAIGYLQGVLNAPRAVTDRRGVEAPRSDVSAVPPQGGYVAKRCPVRAQLDFDTSTAGIEQVPIGVAQQARIDSGRAFETSVFSTILATHSDAVRISAFGRAASQAETLAAIRSGANVIVGADLPDDSVMRRAGQPDLLIRHDDGWVPVDVKHHGFTEAHERGAVRAGRIDGPLTPAGAEPVDGLRFQRGKLRDDGLQLAHYWRMLEHLGLAPSGAAIGGIIDREGQLWWVDLDEPQWKLWWAPQPVSTLEWYDHEFAFRLDVIAHALARNEDPTLERKVVPVWTAECGGCPWREVCRAELEAADHVSLLPRSTYSGFVWHRRLGRLTRAEVAALDPLTARVMAGERSSAATVDVAGILGAAQGLPPGTPIDRVVDKRKRTIHTRLAEAGIVTVGDLNRLDPATAAYAGAKVGHLPTVIDLARAATSGRPWRTRGVDRVKVPRADVEVDVDMENTEAGCYLWGALVTGDGAFEHGYVPHVTWDPIDAGVEATLFAGFWAWLNGIRGEAERAGRTFAAYYFTPAENTQMRRITATGGPGVPSPDEVETFLAGDEWVDLHQVFADQIVTGDGTGLKRVAPIAGFHWRDEDPGGDQSTVWYHDAVYAADPAVREDNRRRLLEYNEDDVTATAVLRDWMSAEGPRLESIETWPTTPISDRAAP